MVVLLSFHRARALRLNWQRRHHWLRRVGSLLRLHLGDLALRESNLEDRQLSLAKDPAWFHSFQFSVPQQACKECCA